MNCIYNDLARKKCRLVAEHLVQSIYECQKLILSHERKFTSTTLIGKTGIFLFMEEQGRVTRSKLQLPKISVQKKGKKKKVKCLVQSEIIE